MSTFDRSRDCARLSTKDGVCKHPTCAVSPRAGCTSHSPPAPNLHVSGPQLEGAVCSKLPVLEASGVVSKQPT